MKKLLLGFCLGIIASLVIFIFKDKSDLKINSFQNKISTQSEQKRQEKYINLYKLSPEVQISYFEDLLGKPTFINKLMNIEKNEYVFTDPDYFVQALTDSDGKILTYSVISRKKDFNPVFELSGQFKVTLNKSTLADYLPDNEQPLTCYRFLGAHDPVYYFEDNFYGNPGNYLHYLVGVWQGSIPDTENYYPNIEKGKIDMSWQGSIDCKFINKEQRNKTVPNSYIVWSVPAYANIKTPPIEYFGPNSIQVRTLQD